LSFARDLPPAPYRVPPTRKITKHLSQYIKMATNQIVGVRMSATYGSYEHITYVQYNGQLWNREYVIQLIEANKDSFFVMSGRDRSEVGVVYPGNLRAPYLRTHADGKWDDNLLSLPRV
jgi:hypothetical protein